MITFLMPSANVPRGGNKYTIRMAEVLRCQGHEVQLYEGQARAPEFFSTNLPVSNRIDRNPHDVFVIPEDQNQVLRVLKDYPQKKIIYCQNQFYAAQGLNGAPGFSAFGVSHMLCSSLSVLHYAKVRHTDLQLHYVPYGIDPGLFTADQPEKIEQIAYNPYKRPVELRYIHDLFRFLYPEYQHWNWKPLHKLTETETARVMAESAVFLSLNRLDSLGLMPLEAMLCGCVVAGFKGLGAEEYGTLANGFWTPDDDLDACVRNLKRAAELSSGVDLASYRQAAQATASRYDLASFIQATGEAWSAILI